MAKTTEASERIEQLKALLDELSAPDLTIARANVLRPELARVLDALQQQPPRTGSAGKAVDASPIHPVFDLLPFPTPIPLRSVG